MVSSVIHAKRILTPAGWLEHAIVKIVDGNIAAIEKNHQSCQSDIILMPALIDTHIHGAMGVDVMDSTHQALNTISCFLARFGVGAFLATTVTDTHQQIENALRQVKESMVKGVDGATILGSYLEGPFFNADHRGAHPGSLLQPPDRTILEKWIAIADGSLKCIALAPEYPDSIAIIQWLRSQNIRVMLGHTNADYQTARDALLAGANGVVHCYNGMSGLHHRNPGVVGAAFSIPNCQTEIIADGHHVHPAAVDIALTCCKQNLLLISDAMRAAGMPNGSYYLGKLLVHMQDSVVRTDDGGLAGSTLTLDRAVSNFADFTHLPFEEAWLHGSYYPAKALGIDHYLGSISPGKQANLVMLTTDRQITKTLVKGKTVFDATIN